MSFGKVVKLFLVDGNPNGRWICELANWTGCAYKIPRNMVKRSQKDRLELQTPGVYFLFGYDEENDKPLVYIGETESIAQRLNQHLESKDYWTEAIAFITKDDFFNKAYIKYLEHEFYQIAIDCDRYIVKNNTIPTQSIVSESDVAVLGEFMYNAKILVNALGHKVFEDYEEKQDIGKTDDNKFYLNTGGISAIGIQTSDGFVLLKGSEIKQERAKSVRKGILQKIEQSEINGEIKNGILQKDKLFSSSSSAAVFAAGYSINGPQSWKTKDGMTLKEFETQN